MSQYPSPYGSSPTNLDYQSRVGTSTVSQFFNAVYAWMAAGLALTDVLKPNCVCLVKLRPAK